MLTAIAEAMPELLVVVVIVVITRARHRFAADFLRRHPERAASRLTWLDADSARPTRRLADSRPSGCLRS